MPSRRVFRMLRNGLLGLVAAVATAPRHDNVANGMEGKLLAVLAEMRTNGLFEFNSQPYIGYTITALLNLEAFAAEPVRVAARGVLDMMNWSYALGTYGLRHFPPFRRRYEYAAATSLTFGYQSASMQLMFDKGAGYFVQLGHGPGASPDIYAAGPRFLLSAGGSNRGE